MGTPFSGKYGRFQINGTNCTVDSWTADMNIDIIDANSFEDQVIATGRLSEVVVDGIDRCRASVSGYYDAAASPTSVGLYVGATLTNVKLFTRKSVAASCVTLPTAVVEKVNIQTNVKDKVKFSAEIRSNGAFSWPTA